MSACEKCWDEYRRRTWDDPDVTYSQVVAESDARGGCTPVEQCGDRHDLFVTYADGTKACRCGHNRVGAPAGGHQGRSA